MKYKKFFEDVTLGAGDILMKYYNKVHRVQRKPGAGIVTEADKASEAFILKKIFRNYPKSSIITEESGEFKNLPDMLWVIDPLDGTTNYAHGFPWFCVSIGLQVEGMLMAGAVFNPYTKEYYYAERSKGAFFQGKRIRVSKTKKIEDSLLGTGFYYSKGKSLKEEIDIFNVMNEYALGVRRPGAAALDLACVAAGRYDAFWERKLSPWDVAAGMLLVEEAHGTISNYSGGATDIHAGELLVSNGHLHRRMVSLIKKALK